jgi:hypothetical protein
VAPLPLSPAAASGAGCGAPPSVAAGLLAGLQHRCTLLRELVEALESLVPPAVKCAGAAPGWRCSHCSPCSAIEAQSTQ